MGPRQGGEGQTQVSMSVGMGDAVGSDFTLPVTGEVLPVVVNLSISRQKHLPDICSLATQTSDTGSFEMCSV